VEWWNIEHPTLNIQRPSRPKIQEPRSKLQRSIKLQTSKEPVQIQTGSGRKIHGGIRMDTDFLQKATEQTKVRDGRWKPAMLLRCTRNLRTRRKWGRNIEHSNAYRQTEDPRTKIQAPGKHQAPSFKGSKTCSRGSTLLRGEELLDGVFHHLVVTRISSPSSTRRIVLRAGEAGFGTGWSVQLLSISQGYTRPFIKGLFGFRTYSDRGRTSSEIRK